jgi:hypothetical protein
MENALPLGTFSASDGEVTITYDPDALNTPAVLVATLIHELAHYLLASVSDPAPGGEELHEYLTDLMTVFLGFGLFGANRAFEFSQHGDSFGQGWRYSRCGYLRERDWVFALSVFLALRDEKVEAVRALLKPHLYRDLRKAAWYLFGKPRLIEELRAAG